ncbi:MAG TPA: polysaccharide pyruvyl transferase family protein [Steroidobacteraceae bacterium]
MSKPRPRRFGVIAHVGMGNIGDELLFAAMVSLLRGVEPEAELVAFTMDPERTLSMHDIAAYPVRPVLPRPTPTFGAKARLTRWRDRAALLGSELDFLRKAVSRVRKLDAIFVAGSSNLIEAYGGWRGFPLAFARWMAAASVCRVPVHFVSMGAEDIKTAQSRALLKWVLARARTVAVRDDVSLRRLRDMGVTRQIALIPDLAFGLPLECAPPVHEPRVVGVNPIPYYLGAYWRANDPARFKRYLDALSGFCLHVLRQGYRLVLYGTTAWADGIAIGPLTESIRANASADELERVSREEVHTPDDLWRVLARVDVVVASRYHGVVSALMRPRPVIGIAYEHKTTDLMQSFGLGDFSLPIETLHADALIKSFEALTADLARFYRIADAGNTERRLELKNHVRTLAAR